MKKNTISLTCCLLLFLSFLNCNKKEENISKEIWVDNFPSIEILKGIPVEKIELMLPVDIKIVDSLLIILNTKNEEHFFDIYNTNTMEFVGKFGDKGKGPTEFIELEFIGQDVEIGGKGHSLVYDWRNKKINYIDFNDYITNGYVDDIHKQIPNNLVDVANLIYYNDSLIIATPTGSAQNPGRFVIYNNNKMHKERYLPKLPFKIHENNLYPIYANASSFVDVVRKKIILTTPLLGQYDFFDFSGNILSSIIIDRDEILIEKAKSSNLVFNEPVKRYTTKVIPYTKENMCSLYTVSLPEKEKPLNSKIHVFDWGGNPIKEFELDFPLLSFAYDDINKCFFGLTYLEDKGKYGIVKFSLD